LVCFSSGLWGLVVRLGSGLVVWVGASSCFTLGLRPALLFYLFGRSMGATVLVVQSRSCVLSAILLVWFWPVLWGYCFKLGAGFTIVGFGCAVGLVS
jgi:hypothetical protein